MLAGTCWGVATVNKAVNPNVLEVEYSINGNNHHLCVGVGRGGGGVGSRVAVLTITREIRANKLLSASICQFISKHIYLHEVGETNTNTLNILS